jgi:8-oxo-dGTP pyrophosphatase MutT (NUDIX family)
VKIFELFARPKRQKAGIIPYFIGKDGTIEMLFMVSSDARYGGPDPMISKGRVEHGEDPAEGAVREAEEELGLKVSNLKGQPFELMKNEMRGDTEDYTFFCYGAEVKSKGDFGKYHYETGSTHWMTNDEFQKAGRRNHRQYAQKLFDKLSKERK